MAGLGEVDEVLDFGELGQVGFELGEGVGDGEALAEEDLVGLAHGGLGLLGDAVAFHPDFVDGAGLGRVAVGDHEGRDVLHDLGAAADHGELPDAAELVHGRESADDGVVADGHMAGEGGHVGHDDVAAELAVVRDVAVGYLIFTCLFSGRVLRLWYVL